MRSNTFHDYGTSNDIPSCDDWQIFHLFLMFEVKVKSFSHVWLFVTPWTAACQPPLSTRFSRQEYCSGLLFPSPGDLPNPGIEPGSPALQADTLTSEPPGKPRLCLLLTQFWDFLKIFQIWVIFQTQYHQYLHVFF